MSYQEEFKNLLLENTEGIKKYFSFCSSIDGDYLNTHNKRFEKGDIQEKTLVHFLKDTNLTYVNKRGYDLEYKGLKISVKSGKRIFQKLKTQNITLVNKQGKHSYNKEYLSSLFDLLLVVQTDSPFKIALFDNPTVVKYAKADNSTVKTQIRINKSLLVRDYTDVVQYPKVNVEYYYNSVYEFMVSDFETNFS